MRHMWQSIQAITGQQTATLACNRIASLPDGLNNYPQFDTQNTLMVRKLTTPTSDQMPRLTMADVREDSPQR